MRSERCERIAVRRPEGMSVGMRTGQKPGRKVRERETEPKSAMGIGLFSGRLGGI